MFTFYQARLEHLDDILILFNCYRQFYGMEVNEAAAKAFIKARLSEKDSLIFLAKQGDALAGFMQVYPSFSSVAMRPTWTLNDLFVAKAMRRQGCASAMLIALVDKAKQSQIFSIKLATTKDNQPAQSVYLNFGFELISDFDYYSYLIK